MCMYLTNGNFLGQRLIGYDCFDSKSKGFIGMSEKQIIDKLKRGERVYGFVLGNVDEKETLALDVDGFNMTTQNRNDDRWGQWFSILGWQRKTNTDIPIVQTWQSREYQ